MSPKATATAPTTSSKYELFIPASLPGASPLRLCIPPANAVAGYMQRTLKSTGTREKILTENRKARRCTPNLTFNVKQR